MLFIILFLITSSDFQCLPEWTVHQFIRSFCWWLYTKHPISAEIFWKGDSRTGTLDSKYELARSNPSCGTPVHWGFVFPLGLNAHLTPFTIFFLMGMGFHYNATMTQWADIVLLLGFLYLIWFAAETKVWLFKLPLGAKYKDKIAEVMKEGSFISVIQIHNAKKSGSAIRMPERTSFTLEQPVRR